MHAVILGLLVWSVVMVVLFVELNITLCYIVLSLFFFGISFNEIVMKWEKEFYHLFITRTKY